MKRLAEIGEREAIRQIQRILTKGKQSLGIGDDCATIDMGDTYLLVTTDMLSEQTHIPKGMTAYQMGWFLVAINLSDIAAKGGIPLGVTCSFGLPKTTSETFLKQLTKGVDACAVCFGTTIVGGDTKETTEITLCGTAFGIVKKDEFMPRRGIRPGDAVAVTGKLGSAGVGYYTLQTHPREKKLSKHILEPRPRLKEGRLLAQLHMVTSSMDLSDGLSTSLYQLQDVNTVGFEIDADALPLAPGLNQRFQNTYGIDPCEVALHFGGDYELLVTIPSQKITQVQKHLQHHGVSFTRIGTATKNKKIHLSTQGHKKILPNKGYEHFKNHYF